MCYGFFAFLTFPNNQPVIDHPAMGQERSKKASWASETPIRRPSTGFVGNGQRPPEAGALRTGRVYRQLLEDCQTLLSHRHSILLPSRRTEGLTRG